MMTVEWTENVVCVCKGDVVPVKCLLNYFNL